MSKVEFQIHKTYGSRSAPGAFPIVGNAINFLRPRHELLEWFVSCQKAFGLDPFTISIPSLPPVVVVNDPQNLEFVLKNDEIITKGEYIIRRSWDLFGWSLRAADSLLVASNIHSRLWYNQRRRLAVEIAAESWVEVLCRGAS